MPTLAARDAELRHRLLTDPAFAAEAAYAKWTMLRPYGGPAAHVAWLAFAAACAGLNANKETSVGRPSSRRDS